MMFYAHISIWVLLTLPNFMPSHTRSESIQIPDYVKTIVIDNFNGNIQISGIDGMEVNLGLEIDNASFSATSIISSMIREDSLFIYLDLPGYEYQMDSESMRWKYRAISVIPNEYTVNMIVRVPKTVNVLSRIYEIGDLAIEGIAKNVQAETVIGSIGFENIMGKIIGKTVRGDIRIGLTSAISNSLCQTFEGDIILNNKDQVPINIRAFSARGNIYSSHNMFEYVSELTQSIKSPNSIKITTYSHIRVKDGMRELTLKTIHGNILLNL
jgi:hypothetical protein